LASSFISCFAGRPKIGANVLPVCAGPAYLFNEK